MSFMDKVDRYRKMNDVVLLCGFTMGGVFGEYYLAVSKSAGGVASAAVQRWRAAILLLLASTAYLAHRTYRVPKLAAPKKADEAN